MAVPIIYHKGITIYYAHVPKTGGTSVEAYLEERFPVIALQGNPKRAPKRDIISPVNHISRSDMHDILPRGLDFTFATVRDPLSRITSEYRYQYGASRIGKLTFSTWLRVVLRCAALDPRIYDNHIRPQSDLVPEGARVFKLENGLEAIPEWIDKITQTTKEDISIGHLLKREHRKLVVSRQDLALLRDFYSIDYQRFDYETSVLEGVAPHDHFAPLREAFARFIAPLLVMKHRRVWLA